MSLLLLLSEAADKWNIDFTDGVLPDGMTFSRASAGAYFDASGSQQMAAVDEARFDHIPSTGTALGLLIEAAATNMFQHSEDFTNAWWGKTGATVSGSVVTIGSANTQHYVVSTSITYTGGQSYVHWYDVEAGTYDVFQIFLNSGAFSGGRYANFDLINGVVGNVHASVTASMIDLGGGVWRCIAISTADTGATGGSGYAFTNSLTGSRLATFTGNGTDSFTVYRGQCEADDGATSYIATTTAASTRAADQASLTLPYDSNFITYTFDDGSTQTVLEFGGDYTIPTDLNRPWIARMTIKKPPTLSLPTAFSWLPFSIVPIGDGTYKSTFNIDDYKPTGNATYYFSPLSGSDSTGDGSEATPYQTLAKALTPSDCGEVICLDDGNIPLSKWGNLPGTPKLKNNTIIRCPSGVVNFLGGEYDVAWTKTDGYTNVYEYANGNVVGLHDEANISPLTNFGKMVLVANIATVDSTAGSFYVDTGAGITYAHTYDDRVPDADVFPAETNAEFTIFGSSSKNVSLWMENINTYNTPTVKFRVNGATYKLTVYAKNCGAGFSKAASGNGCWSFLGTTSFLKGCTAYGGDYDGFSYHQSGGACKMYEEDCTAYLNGISGASNDNGSTNHSDGVTGAACVRLNGEYYGNYGPNIADVTAGMNSLNVGCYAHNDLSNGNKINFQIDGAGSSGYFIDCTSEDADFDIQATTSAVARYFNTDGTTFTTSGNVTKADSAQECLNG